MHKPILLILAAGMGSRYGGLKQVDPVGPAGETILDYSVYDAYQAGFRHLVFVIRQEHEELFRQEIIQNYPEDLLVHFAYQSLEDLPTGLEVPSGREKPWGTGHAVYAARQLLDQPFGVINADDFYGREAFEKLYQFLAAEQADQEHIIVAFPLIKTVSEHGTVSRGICQVSQEGYLEEVQERTAISPKGENAQYEDAEGHLHELSGQALASMNFWGFQPSIMAEVERSFPIFYEKEVRENPLKAEYFLPSIVSEMIEGNRGKVQVTTANDQWYGVTYKKDKEVVMSGIAQMTELGKYPSPLWQEEEN